MVSVEDLLTAVKGVLDSILDVLSPPHDIICGFKDNINTSGQRLTEKKTRVHDMVTVKVRSLGTGTWIALGNEDEQPYRLTAVGASQDIRVDDLSKIIVLTDAGTTGALEWFGA